MDEKLNKIFDHSECPPGEVLRKYVQGELSGKELRSFEEHLASCEMCSDEVEGMAFINNPEKIEADVTFLKQQIDSKLATDAAPKTIPMYLKIAAAVLFLFAVSFIVYVIINNNSLSEKSLLSVNTNSDRIIHKEALSEEKKPVAKVVQSENKDKKATLLVAEDDVSNYKLAEAILGKEYNLIHAWNGEEAVQLFRENLPDLVLMDIKMPILNGYESFQKIRELSGNVPVIAVTAYASEEDQSIIRNKGFNDFVAKPIYASLLKDKIAALLKVD